MNKNGENRKCKSCGDEYYIPKSRLSNSNFCSVKCKNKKRNPEILKKCTACGKDFLAQHNNYRDTDRKYCSLKCYRRSKKQNIVTVCEHCKREFKVTKGVLSRGRKFCSVRCRYAESKTQKHWRDWRKKYRKEGRGYQGSKNANTNRKNVFQYKSKECEICGFGNEAALDIHHVDRNCDNNTLINLAVLCCNCHRLLHRGLVKYEAPKLFMNIFPIKVIARDYGTIYRYGTDGLIQQAGAKA